MKSETIETPKPGEQKVIEVLGEQKQRIIKLGKRIIEMCAKSDCSPIETLLTLDLCKQTMEESLDVGVKTISCTSEDLGLEKDSQVPVAGQKIGEA